jgi:hypothetical protein
VTLHPDAKLKEADYAALTAWAKSSDAGDAGTANRAP